MSGQSAPVLNSILPEGARAERHTAAVLGIDVQTLRKWNRRRERQAFIQPGRFRYCRPRSTAPVAPVAGTLIETAGTAGAAPRPSQKETGHDQ